MLKKSIEAIIAEGVAELQVLAESAERVGTRAKEQVERCKGEINTLTALAKDVPEKVFDRHSNVLITTMDLNNGNSGSIWAEIRLNGACSQLRGLMGPDQIKPGKYRVVVLMEPLS